MNYKPVIGLEVHVELKTNSKMFCGCSADYFGKKPNTHCCPVCLGLPGALPVANKKAIDWCIMIGQALNCEIADFSKFDRKNYFYPDLAKGYQISQYDLPFCSKGEIELSTGKKIKIRRVHMEEDTAKLIHEFGNQKSKIKNQNDEGSSLIDFNRSGVPLVEIVTEPDFESALEVKEYLQKLQQIVRYLGVSNADMEKGDMRLEPNISLKLVILANEVRPESGSWTSQDDKTKIELPPYKVEVKNINSFKFVEKAINYEIKRQEEILNENKTPVQETRGWNEVKQITVTQRIKEEANDYRYFPEPDLPPIKISEQERSDIQSQMPELPDTKFERFKKEYGLSDYDAEILTRDKKLADYFEEAIRVNQESLEIKSIANWIINKKPDIEQILPAELLNSIFQAKQTVAVDQDELEKVIKKVLIENPKAVEDYKRGKETVIMFLVGQVMRSLGKKIDANIIKTVIQKKLK